MSLDPSPPFRPNEYDRPNQAWACGGEAQGMPCPLGPTQLGVCQSECTPRKEGDRYYCDHASQLAGSCDEGPLPDGLCCQMPSQCVPAKQAGEWTCNRGKCQEGPLPDGSCSMKFSACQPVRGTLARRRLTVLAVLGLALGAILLMTGAPNRLALVSPGALSNHHQGTEGCQDCHSVGEGRLVDWIHAAFSPSSGPSQTQLCLECHTELGENATYAHGLAPEGLSELTNDVDLASFTSSESLLLQAARRIQPTEHKELACKTCHSEHHGEGFDMTQMANRECQVCHRQTFDSFHEGHPELASFFYQRRTRLHFNHASHAIVHFSNFERTVPGDSESLAGAKGAPDCADCHFPDGSGQSMLTRGFEASCASCHEHQITDDEFLPITILRVPLSPASADQPTASATPFMRLLLSGTSAQKGAEKLLEEMLHQDHQALEQRLSESLGADEGADELSRLAKTLTQLDFQRVDRQRLIALLAEGNVLETEHDEQASSEDRSSWHFDRSPDVLTLSYRPTGHADLFLKTWLEAGARHTGATAFRKDRDAESPLTAIFRQLTGPTQAGRCLKCHTVGEADDSRLQMEWWADRPQEGHREFTQFDHAPHLTLGNKATCTTCHPIDSESELVLFKPEFFHRDHTINTSAQATEASGFHPVEKSVCSKCHQRATAGDSCLMCHQYHIH